MNVTIHATYCTLGTNAERTPQRPRRPATLVIATDDGMMPQRHAAFARLRSLGDERPPIAAMAKALGVPSTPVGSQAWRILQAAGYPSAKDWRQFRSDFAQWYRAASR